MVLRAWLEVDPLQGHRVRADGNERDALHLVDLVPDKSSSGNLPKGVIVAHQDQSLAEIPGEQRVNKVRNSAFPAPPSPSPPLLTCGA